MRGAAQGRRAVPSASRVRERLVGAIVDLLETREPSVITVDVMVRAAHLSRATFYRQFDDREAAVSAALRLSAKQIADELPAQDRPYGDAASERRRTSAWVEALIEACARRPRLQRRVDWRVPCEPVLSRYLEALRALGVVDGESARLALGTLDVVEGVLVRLTASRAAAGEGSEHAAAIAVRLIFGHGSGARTTK